MAISHAKEPKHGRIIMEWLYRGIFKNALAQRDEIIKGYSLHGFRFRGIRYSVQYLPKSYDLPTLPARLHEEFITTHLEYLTESQLDQEETMDFIRKVISECHTWEQIKAVLPEQLRSKEMCGLDDSIVPAEVLPENLQHYVNHDKWLHILDMRFIDMLEG